MRADDWSAEAIEASNHLHSSMVNVYFDVHNVIDNYYFGNLSYQTIDNRVIELKSILEQKLRLAIAIDSNTFQKGILQLSFKSANGFLTFLDFYFYVLRYG